MFSAKSTKDSKQSAMKYVEIFIRAKNLGENFKDVDETLICSKDFLKQLCDFFIELSVSIQQTDNGPVAEAMLRSG
jgi:hypothetical protein